MRSLLLILTFCATATSISAQDLLEAVGLDRAFVPSVTVGGPTLWVGAELIDHAATSEELRAFMPQAIESYLELAESSINEAQYRVDGCLRITIENDSWVDVPATLEDAVRKADKVLMGVVAETQSGFFYESYPGQLLTVTIDNRPKDLGVPSPSEVKLFYRAGLVEVGDRRYCIETPGIPEPPPVGSRIFFLLDDLDAGDIETVAWDAVFYETVQGRLATSSKWSAHTKRARTLSELSASVTSGEKVNR